MVFVFFLFAGRVPTLQEGNMMESIFNFPWSKERPVVLGMHHVDEVPAVPLIYLFTISNHKFAVNFGRIKI